MEDCATPELNEAINTSSRTGTAVPVTSRLSRSNGTASSEPFRAKTRYPFNPGGFFWGSQNLWFRVNGTAVQRHPLGRRLGFDWIDITAQIFTVLEDTDGNALTDTSGNTLVLI